MSGSRIETYEESLAQGFWKYHKKQQTTVYRRFVDVWFMILTPALGAMLPAALLLSG